MGQAELAPFCIVEFFFGEGEGSGFGEVSLTGTEVKIEGGIGSIALEKFPIEVHQQRSRGAGVEADISADGARSCTACAVRSATTDPSESVRPEWSRCRRVNNGIGT